MNNMMQHRNSMPNIIGQQQHNYSLLYNQHNNDHSTNSSSNLGLLADLSNPQQVFAIDKSEYPSSFNSSLFHKQQSAGSNELAHDPLYALSREEQPLQTYQQFQQEEQLLQQQMQPSFDENDQLEQQQQQQQSQLAVPLMINRSRRHTIPYGSSISPFTPAAINAILPSYNESHNITGSSSSNSDNHTPPRHGLNAPLSHHQQLQAQQNGSGRRLKTPMQTRLLRNSYERSTKPCNNTVISLVKTTGLSREEVKRWFR